MTKTSYAIILSTAALLTAVSCKKKEEPPPAVSLSLPVSDSRFSVGDTIQVSGQVSDVNPLQSVTITLINADFQPVAQTIPLETNKNNFSFSIYYLINNPELPTGTYYMSLSASDGMNSASYYSLIYLNATPKQRLGIYLVTAADNNWTYIAYLDSANKAEQLFTFSGDYCAASISSLHKQLYVCGKYSGSLNAINLGNKSIAWTIPSLGNSLPFFEGMSYYNGVNYVSYYNGNIIGYGDGESVTFKATADGAYYPVNIFYQNGYILVEQHPVSGNGEMLVEYYSSGVAAQEVALDAAPVQMFTIDQNDLLLFGNNSTQGVIEIYNTQSNAINELGTCGLINDAVQVDIYHYFLALTTGIYEYEYSSNNLVLFANVSNASSIAYDDVNNELMVATGTMLNVYDAGGGGLQYSVAASNNIKKVLILFNR